MRAKNWVWVPWCVVLLSSCKREPSAAELALEQFAVAVARGWPTDELIEGDATIDYDSTGGEPEEGALHAVRPTSVGIVAWTRSTLEDETRLPSGARRVQLAFSLCLRAEDQSCVRPNQYRYTALMRQSEGAWRVAGSTSEIIFEVR